MSETRRRRSDLDNEDVSHRRAVYIDQSCGIGAWSKLNAQRLAGDLCDVILKAEGGVRHYAHRCVLAASAEYFSRMFMQSGFSEFNQQEIELHCVPEEALVAILDFMYSGSLELATENVHAVVFASDYFQFPAPRQWCVTFMSKFLESDEAQQEALNIALTADQFGFPELSDQAWEVVFENFEEVSSSTHFKELSLQDLLLILLQSNHFVTEEDVWWGALDWLEHDLEIRRRHVDEVIGCVRFPLMTTETLMDVVKTHNFTEDSAHIRKLIDEALWYKICPRRQSKMQTSQTLPRGSIIRGVFCLIGESFYVYMPQIQIWYSLASPLGLPVNLSGHEGAITSKLILANKKLYAIGIRECSSDAGGYVVESFQWYDDQRNSWREEPLPSQQENTVFIECAEALYACSRNAVEVYDNNYRSWRVLCRHSFVPYHFVWAKKDRLHFHALDSGIMVEVNVRDGGVTFKRQLAAGINPDMEVTLHTGDGILVSYEDIHGYVYRVFNTRTHQFEDVFGGEADRVQEPKLPLCVDPFYMLHVNAVDDMLLVMAPHSSVISYKYGQDVYDHAPVSDGVIPFFQVENGLWLRLPSIPEQPGKPISMCSLDGSTGTNVASPYIKTTTRMTNLYVL